MVEPYIYKPFTNGVFMFIFSPDERIKKEIGPVVFECLPPVGDTELKFMQFIDNGMMPKVKKVVDKSLDGKKVSKEEYVKLLEIEMEKQAEDTQYETIKMIGEAVDMVLVGWSGEGIPKFPKDGKPSRYLPTSVKQEIFNWYQNQFSLTVEDSKN